MRFVSTRGQAPALGLSDALRQGLAADGGLYVPESSPTLTAAAFAGLESLPEIATRLLEPFFAGDLLAPELPSICARAFDFPIVLKPFGAHHLLELIHGPTLAFKDFGARFLAEAMSRIECVPANPLTIVVATSGDTGGAVAAAFAGRPGFRVLVLYPDGRVSQRQEIQLTCWPDNVRALKVSGSFDDCQRLAKALLSDPQGARLSSANSISLGRLLPQMGYHAWAAITHERAYGQPIDLVIPTGNLGNALAAVWVRAIGLPIGRIDLACNANDTLPKFFAGADYHPQSSVATLASAMDVGAPSNVERLRWLSTDAELRRGLSGGSVSDTAIANEIQTVAAHTGEVLCPHTATAAVRARDLGGCWTLVATAHPAKFETIVEPLIGQTVQVPPALAALLDRPTQTTSVAPELKAVRALL
jgi:threonine synthase